MTVRDIVIQYNYQMDIYTTIRKDGTDAKGGRMMLAKRTPEELKRIGEMYSIEEEIEDRLYEDNEGWEDDLCDARLGFLTDWEKEEIVSGINEVRLAVYKEHGWNYDPKPCILNDDAEEWDGDWEKDPWELAGCQPSARTAEWFALRYQL